MQMVDMTVNFKKGGGVAEDAATQECSVMLLSPDAHDAEETELDAPAATV
jgi:hypothetical protein